MKVLAISASPRKGGNSDLLVDQFLKGAAEAGHVTEKVRFDGLTIWPCKACDYCKTNVRCSHIDDMAKIQHQMLTADVIVLATPIYFFSMSGQLKVMIDRCRPKYAEMKNKQFYYILTSANPNADAVDSTVAGLRGFLRCLPGAQEKGVIHGAGVNSAGEIAGTDVFRQAYEAGMNIV
ncbi:MAG: flavodoxin family protein [Eubacterium sp.]|nr:flavodoxin family protein [Eubacterium sp.]